MGAIILITFPFLRGGKLATQLMVVAAAFSVCGVRVGEYNGNTLNEMENVMAVFCINGCETDAKLSVIIISVLD